jgi:death-on-curing protein
VGIAKNHPFVDGNKHAAFLSLGLFAALNGYRLRATQVEATLTMLAVASSELDEPSLAAWIRLHLMPR